MESYLPKIPEGDISPVYEQVMGSLQPLLAELTRRATPHLIDQLRSFYREDSCPRIDYDVFGEAFASAYFVRNFWKVVATLEAMPPNKTCTILDLGSGPGSATVATLAWVAAHGERGPIELTLVDVSSQQLELAGRIVREVARTLHVDLRVQSHRSEIAVLPEQGNRDVILLSHVLNENASSLESLLQIASGNLAPNGRIYVIERVDDPIWDELQAAARETFFPTTRGSARVSHRPQTDSVRADNKCCSETAFLLVEAPSDQQLAKLLHGYFKSWRCQSIDLLENVFAADATYQTAPFSEPLIGIEAIKLYWARTVMRQDTRSIEVGRVAYGPLHAFVEWRARLGYGHHHERVEGILLVERKANLALIASLHECYSKRIVSQDGTPKNRR